MSATASGLFADSLLALRERKRVLDAAWLLTFFVALVAVALPWYLRVLEIDFAPVAWGTLVFALVFTLVSRAADRLRRRRWLLVVMTGMQAAGILFLAALWQLAGGLQNPMMLLLFVLPVIAVGITLQSWQPYASALLGVAAVVTVALATSPELRWYMTQLGLPAEAIARLLPDRLAAAPEAFAAFDAPPSYHFLLLALFAGLTVTAAGVSETLAGVLLELYQRLALSTDALSRAEGLSEAVLESSPVPTVLVYRDTAQVVRTSASFHRNLILDRDELAGKTLFEVVSFTYPEVVEELLAEGGEAPFVVYRVGEEPRVARVRVDPLEHGDERYAQVSLQDLSELYYLQAALEAVDDPFLVLGTDHRVSYFNRAAATLFGDLHFGLEAAAALEVDDLPEGWWDLGPHRLLDRRLELADGAYRARIVAAPVPGERRPLSVLTLRAERS